MMVRKAGQFQYRFARIVNRSERTQHAVPLPDWRNCFVPNRTVESALTYSNHPIYFFTAKHTVKWSFLVADRRPVRLGLGQQLARALRAAIWHIPFLSPMIT